MRRRWPLASAGGVFIAILAALATYEFTAPFRPRAVENMASTVPDVPPADLIVSEVVFVRAAEDREIAGVLKNRSGRTYSDIQMTFSLIGADGDNVGSAEATVHQLGGHATAEFRTSGVTLQAVEIVLKQIEARPPLAGAP